MTIAVHISRLLARLGRRLFESHDARRLGRQQIDTSDLLIRSDIPYIDDGTMEHMLDIYCPAGRTDELPVIVNIHGGGLFASFNKVNAWFNHEWARRGYAVVSISYRRIPDTTLVHQIEDVMAALRFVRDNSRQYRLDLTRCYLTADSAGALLGLFALAIEGGDGMRQTFGIAPSGIRFRAAAFISIMLDTQRRDPLAFLGKVVSGPEDAGKTYLPYILNPGALVGSSPLPPLYLVTSAEDLIRHDTLRLGQLLAAGNTEYSLTDLPKGGQHKLVHVFSVQYPLWPESRQVFAEADAFFRAH